MKKDSIDSNLNDKKIEIKNEFLSDKKVDKTILIILYVVLLSVIIFYVINNSIYIFGMLGIYHFSFIDPAIEFGASLFDISIMLIIKSFISKSLRKKNVKINIVNGWTTLIIGLFYLVICLIDFEPNSYFIFSILFTILGIVKLLIVYL